MNRYSLAIGVSLCLGGCASLTSPARVHRLEPASNYWFDYEGSRRGTVLASTTDDKGRPAIRSCAEPSPDVALAIAAAGDAGANYRGIEGQASADVRQRVQELGERTQMVMFFREALFRVCEMSLNQNLEPSHITSLYKDIIRTALFLGSAKALDLETIAARQRLEDTLAEKSATGKEIIELKLRISSLEAENRNAALRKLAELEHKSTELDAKLIGEYDAMARLSGDSPRALQPATATSPNAAIPR